MRYYKMIIDGYLVAVGSGSGGTEITAEEYAELLNIIRTKPVASEGYEYRLKADLTWELYELPPVPAPEDEDATEADYIAALNELGVPE